MGQKRKQQVFVVLPVTSFLFVFIRQRVEIACICLIPLLYCQCTGNDEEGSGAEGVSLDAKLPE